MQKILIITILTFLVNIVNAQDKELTIRDAAVGQWFQLRPQNYENLQWNSSSTFTFNDFQLLYQKSVNKDITDVLFSLQEINILLKGISVDECPKFPEIVWYSENQFFMFQDINFIIIDYKQKKIIKHINFPEGAENFEFSKEANSIAFTVKNQLFYTKIDQPDFINISCNLLSQIVDGQIVSRNEFGINKGIFWSPDGKMIAFYRKNESQVTDYPLVDIYNRIAKPAPDKYPMAGMKSEHVCIGIYNISTKKTLFIENDTISEKYLTSVTWDPQEKYLFVGVLNRQQNHFELNKYNVETSKIDKCLLKEDNNKYVEPLYPLTFKKKNPNLFIYQSEQYDGFNHLFLYNVDGHKLKQLTSGQWVVTNVYGFDNAGQNLYFAATKESPLEQHIYKVNIENLEVTKLSSEKGTHTGLINPTGDYVIDRFSSITVPNSIYLLNSKGKVVRKLLESQNPLQTYKLGEMSFGTIKAADDSTDLYYRIIKPSNFDPSKKYPVILYVYGGPHAQLVTNSWLGGARLWDLYMAQKGFIIFTLDNRGSDNRGLKFENVIHRQCGQEEMKDQMRGIEFIKNQSFTDTSRIGVHGWSYGGFMTISLMLNHNQIFKTGVAGGPVIDWKYYEVMYGERYMDTPDENPQGYEKTRLLGKTSKLKGKLLIIHGGIDDTVVPQHSLLFVDECIKRNKEIDFFIYPKAEHNVAGYDRIHLLDKISKYFIQNL